MDHSLLLQMLETLREQIGADVRQPVHEVFETARAGQQFADNEECPAFPDSIQRVGQGAELIVTFHKVIDVQKKDRTKSR